MANQIPIPQNPIGENFVWRDWLQRLSNRVFGSMSGQDSGAVVITGGTINATTIGNGTPAPGTFSTLNVTSTAGSSVPWGAVTSQPHIEAYDLSTTIALTSTPTVLKPANTSSGAVGISYDNTTGIFTFTNAGCYTLALSVNATSSAANQFIYIYAENNTGSGWVANANSGKYYDLTNGQTIQIVYSQAVSRVAGQQVRYWIYSNDGKTSLGTQTLPGLSSSVYVPAIRIQYSS